MGGTANSAVDRDDLGFHAGEVQLSGQLLKLAAFLVDGGDVVLLQQLHCLCSGLAITVFQVFQHLSDDFCMDFC